MFERGTLRRCPRSLNAEGDGRRGGTAVRRVGGRGEGRESPLRVLEVRWGVDWGDLVPGTGCGPSGTVPGSQTLCVCARLRCMCGRHIGRVVRDGLRSERTRRSGIRSGLSPRGGRGGGEGDRSRSSPGRSDVPTRRGAAARRARWRRAAVARVARAGKLAARRAYGATRRRRRRRFRVAATRTHGGRREGTGKEEWGKEGLGRGSRPGEGGASAPKGEFQLPFSLLFFPPPPGLRALGVFVRASLCPCGGVGAVSTWLRFLSRMYVYVCFFFTFRCRQGCHERV